MKISENCTVFKLACKQLKREGKGIPVKLGELTIFEYDVGDLFDAMQRIVASAERRRIKL